MPVSASAACYRSLEDIPVMPIIVAELEFRDIERQILFTDFMERADDATLEDAAKTFNRVRMDGASAERRSRQN
jgi:hypothetical protein